MPNNNEPNRLIVEKSLTFSNMPTTQWIGIRGEKRRLKKQSEKVSRFSSVLAIQLAIAHT
jgi:hypothetical protein